MLAKFLFQLVWAHRREGKSASSTPNFDAASPCAPPMPQSWLGLVVPLLVRLSLFAASILLNQSYHATAAHMASPITSLHRNLHTSSSDATLRLNSHHLRIEGHLHSRPPALWCRTPSCLHFDATLCLTCALTPNIAQTPHFSPNRRACATVTLPRHRAHATVTITRPCPVRAKGFRACALTHGSIISKFLSPKLLLSS